VEFPTDGGAFYRVRVGKVSGEQAAQQLGEQLRDREGVKPLIFRLDDPELAEVTNERRLPVLQNRREAIPSKVVYEDEDVFAFEDMARRPRLTFSSFPRKHLLL